MKLFSPRKAKPGDLMYKLTIYHDVYGNISDYKIDEYLIFSITNTNDKSKYIINTQIGNIIYKNKDIYYCNILDAKKILYKKISDNIKKIRNEANNKINLLKKFLV